MLENNNELLFIYDGPSLGIDAVVTYGKSQRHSLWVLIW